MMSIAVPGSFTAGESARGDFGQHDEPEPRECPRAVDYEGIGEMGDIASAAIAVARGSDGKQRAVGRHERAWEAEQMDAGVIFLGPFLQHPHVHVLDIAVLAGEDLSLAGIGSLARHSAQRLGRGRFGECLACGTLDLLDRIPHAPEARDVVHPAHEGHDDPGEDGER